MKLFRAIKILKKKWFLILVFLIGGFLRFYNLNWDNGHLFHPDERNIAGAVTQLHFFDQLNPKFFAYGGLPMYLYREAGDLLVALSKNRDWVYSWGAVNIVGRGVSAFVSTLSIFLVYLVAKSFFGEKSGVISAFLVAFMPSLIQHAHYASTESLLVFWFLLLLFFCFRLLKEPFLKEYTIVGLLFGLAVATKISTLSFLSLILTTHFVVHPKPKKPLKQFLKKFLNHNLKLVWLLLVGLIFFSLTSPYTFLSWQKFKESMNYESGVATGKLRVVYVLQFEKTRAYFFQLKNFFWQMGIVTIPAILGMIYLLYLAALRRDKKIILFLSFPLAYFFYVGSWYTKFLRYMVPILPVLAMSAGYFLIRIYNRWKKMGIAMIFIFLLATFWWGLAYFSIYTRQQTRIAASHWVYQNIPSGARILGEHWDDGLPVTIGNFNPSRYQIEQLTIYESDNQQKIDYFAEKLSGSDYIVINSRRLYGTLINLPEKYPITSHYYRLLFAGRLGYQKVAEFSSYPSFLGIEINDDTSEETFQVYDHPKVMVLKNVALFDQEKLRRIISFHD